VLKAAALMGSSLPLTLEKNLPIASGIGGGSADAAATLRLLSRAMSRPIPDGLSLGADVPVCITSLPQRMTGIGDVLNPVLNLPDFWFVLVNPGHGLRTAQVFETLKQKNNAPMVWRDWQDLGDFIQFLAQQRNDLQAAAIEIEPAIADVLAALAQQNGCCLARMSGSGATCYGIFENRDTAETAAAALSAAFPHWWVKAAKRR
jgi:4-diphosphocytidyl-2-C-methyl-D-erythritol kinase